MNLFSRLNELRNKHTFTKLCASIRRTSPINIIRNDAVTIISMVSHDAVDMYLVAIKSFMHQFRFGNIEVINDGSLTQEDKEVLTYHVPGIAISDADIIDTLGCPTYISWKRLFRVIEISSYSYVIQLDSDTISLGPLIEVYNKVIKNEGFMIGSSKWNEPVDVRFLNYIVSNWNSTHVQPSVEAELVNMEFFGDGTKYIRGCAGFAGYPRGSLSHKMVIDLSRQVETRIGKIKWNKWGSEQTATNCLISKSKNPEILPWPKYRNYMMPPTNDPCNSATFIHFIGTNRFRDSAYHDSVVNFINNAMDD